MKSQNRPAIYPPYSWQKWKTRTIFFLSKAEKKGKLLKQKVCKTLVNSTRAFRVTRVSTMCPDWRSSSLTGLLSDTKIAIKARFKARSTQDTSDRNRALTVLALHYLYINLSLTPIPALFCPQSGSAIVHGFTLLRPQSRTGGKLVKLSVNCPQNGSAVLKGLKGFLSKGEP